LAAQLRSFSRSASLIGSSALLLPPDITLKPHSQESFSCRRNDRSIASREQGSAEGESQGGCRLTSRAALPAAPERDNRTVSPPCADQVAPVPFAHPCRAVGPSSLDQERLSAKDSRPADRINETPRWAAANVVGSAVNPRSVGRVHQLVDVTGIRVGPLENLGRSEPRLINAAA
jgi:hypothetical protein